MRKAASLKHAVDGAINRQQASVDGLTRSSPPKGALPGILNERARRGLELPTVEARQAGDVRDAVAAHVLDMKPELLIVLRGLML